MNLKRMYPERPSGLAVGPYQKIGEMGTDERAAREALTLTNFCHAMNTPARLGMVRIANTGKMLAPKPIAGYVFQSWPEDRQ